MMRPQPPIALMDILQIALKFIVPVGEAHHNHIIEFTKVLRINPMTLLERTIFINA